MMVLRRQGVAFVGRYFIAAMNASVDSRIRGNPAWLPFMIKVVVVELLEVSDVIVKNHA
jgi:hypothetical protein